MWWIHTNTHTHTHEHTHVCIAVFIPVTFPDERDLCVLICSGDIIWYNECVSCYLYLAPLSLYTILHDGKYFITDFCTDWNIITVMWINTMWFIHFIVRMWFNALCKWHIFSNREHGKQGSKFYRNVFTVTTREHPAAEGGTVGEKCLVIFPKCRLTRYI